MKGVMPLFLFKGVKTHEKLKGAEHSVEGVNIPYAHAGE